LYRLNMYSAIITTTVMIARTEYFDNIFLNSFLVIDQTFLRLIYCTVGKESAKLFGNDISRNPYKKPQQCVKGTYLAVEIQPSSGVIPHVPSEYHIHRKSECKFHSAYYDCTHKASYGKRNVAAVFVNIMHEYKTNSARNGHSPMSAPSPQDLDDRIQSTAHSKSNRIFKIFLQKNHPFMLFALKR